MARDSQRSKLYKAERASGIFELKKFATFEEAVAFGKKVECSAYWRKNCSRARRTIAWEVGKGWGSTAYPSSADIILSRKHGLDAATVLHEMAHIANPSCHHDMEFAKCYAGLVRRFLGETAYKSLKAQFKAKRVQYIWKTKPMVRLRPIYEDPQVVMA